jgi:hypothetical protein
MTEAPDSNPENVSRSTPPAEAGSPAGVNARPDADPGHSPVAAGQPRPPRMSRALRVGLIYLVVCLIVGVLLLLYSLRSIVTDLGNYPP